MSEEFTYDRRRFLSTAAMTIAATADAVVAVDGYARHSS